ncbi:glycosyltransferase family 4 protein [Suillus brevipes Sb2]|nr:glycosyltransferase family 4 protein [Suillus brevipes Sb2]
MIYLGINEPLIDEEIVKSLRGKHSLGDSFVVGIIGRIEEAKGQHLVIDALAQLKELNIKALVVGHSMDESYISALGQKVRDLGLENHIVFTGFTKNINEYFQLCDVSVLATKTETFGLVVIESMVNKVPVIATNSGGPLEIIDDKKDGLLFDRTAKDLAKKITLLYEDKDFYNGLTRNGYNKIKDIFDKETQMEKMLELVYES